jgi:hypothetical protein
MRIMAHFRTLLRSSAINLSMTACTGGLQDHTPQPGPHHHLAGPLKPRQAPTLKKALCTSYVVRMMRDFNEAVRSINGPS